MPVAIRERRDAEREAAAGMGAGTGIDDRHNIWVVMPLAMPATTGDGEPATAPDEPATAAPAIPADTAAPAPVVEALPPAA
jgi:hypothetical protein